MLILNVSHELTDKNYYYRNHTQIHFKIEFIELLYSNGVSYIEHTNTFIQFSIGQWNRAQNIYSYAIQCQYTFHSTFKCHDYVSIDKLQTTKSNIGKCFELLLKFQLVWATKRRWKMWFSDLFSLSLLVLDKQRYYMVFFCLL